MRRSPPAALSIPAAAVCTQVRPEEISAWLQSYWWGDPVEAWCAVDHVKTTSRPRQDHCRPHLHTVDRPLRLQPYVYQGYNPMHPGCNPMLILCISGAPSMTGLC